ncbi:MAG: hypothetical protein CM1200mP18_07480 [Gammaproteobacteria bacterium]|nr:MAG: hypothetical protein CM1200mP18_07480 [Gammaproteobacteria bacterium]
MAMGKKAVLEVELHPDSIEMLEYAQETFRIFDQRPKRYE